jgi:uncharacterized sulfatase
MKKGKIKEFVVPAIISLVSLLLVIRLFTAKNSLPILSLYVFLIIYVLVFFVATVMDKQRNIYLLPSGIIFFGVFSYNVVYGLNGVVNNITHTLPICILLVLFMISANVIKKHTVVRFVKSLVSFFMIICTVYMLFTVNIRIRPQVVSLKDGHNRYLSELASQKRAGGPNVMVILMDDMGFGDIGLFASSSIKTPNINRLAEQGVTMDNFYASSPVCSPSRFGCLTGRYPTRGYIDRVLFPTLDDSILRWLNPYFQQNGVDGILGDEITIAESLQASGYQTAAFGKWHLSDYGEYLPNNQGFDLFYGMHYSNDMTPYKLFENGTILQDQIEQKNLTSMMTDRIIDYIDENSKDQFFVYYASPWPHDPVSVSDEYRSVSTAGTYGDCIEEFDNSIGRIIESLESNGVLENTLIIFTSDNGPWYEGSTGGLRGRKNNTFNGGQKVPFIISHPSLMQNEVQSNIAMNIDIFPTIMEFCGIPLPTDRGIDGVSILPLLNGDIDWMDRQLYFINNGNVQAIMNNEFKFFGSVESENAMYPDKVLENQLFSIIEDPTESYNLYNNNLEIAKQLGNELNGFILSISENPRGLKED